MQQKEMDGIKYFYRENTGDYGQLYCGHKDFLVPEYEMKADDVVIDLGAHIGTFCLPLAKRVKKVYAVEACKESFEILAKNVSANDVLNVEMYNIALSDFNGKTTLFLEGEQKGGPLGNTISQHVSGDGEEVDVWTFDKFMERIERCDFCKINIEGAEFELLFGASQETLDKIKLMFVCYHTDLNTKYSENDLMDYLVERGFTLRHVYRRKNRGWIIARKITYRAMRCG